ncbi:MAG: metal ABC transporter substrate-binding protein [Patescibacteria group bacterium]
MSRVKSLVIFAIAMLACGAGVWFILTPARKPADTGRIKVAATFFPLADIARQIGGDNVDVVTLLPPGASPHSFEPAPAQVLEIAQAKALFSIGHGLDDWAGTLANNAPNISQVTVDRGIELKPPLALTYIGSGGETKDSLDPHYWLTPQNGKLIAATIADELKRLDPAHAADYDRRLEDFKRQMDETEARIKTLLSDKKNTAIVTHHAAWQYFAAAFGLKIVGVIEPSPDKELTPMELVALQKIIRANDIKTIFIEPELSEQLVKPLAQDLHLEIRSVDPEGVSSGMKNYQDMLLKNAQTFADALN